MTPDVQIVTSYAHSENVSPIIITILHATLFVCQFPQALQAPACHENMVKVGGYILGEFGNLIAGDPRSR